MPSQSFISTITDVIVKVLREDPPPPGLPPLPEDLRAFNQNLDDLTSLSVSVDGDWSRISDWVNKLKDLSQSSGDSVIVRALQYSLPRLAEVLTFLGVIEYRFDEDMLRRHEIDWTRLNMLLSNPAALFDDPELAGRFQNVQDVMLMQVYSSLLVTAPEVLLRVEYDHAGFTALPSPVPLDLGRPPDVIRAKLLGALQSPVKFPLPPPPVTNVDEYLAHINPPAADPQLEVSAPENQPGTFPPQMGITLRNATSLFEQAFSLGAWKVTLRPLPGAGNQADFTLTYENGWQVDGPNSGELLEIAITRTPTNDAPGLVVGSANGTRFEVATIRLYIKLVKDAQGQPPAFVVGGSLERMALVLIAPVLDYLGGGVGADGLRFQADVSSDFVQGSGLRAQGGPGAALGLDFVKVVNKQVGTGAVSLTIEKIRVRLEASLTEPRRGRAFVLFSASAQFGPVRALMDNAGAWLGYGFDTALGTQLPDGIGLTVDAGPVQGGGFLGLEGQRFSGALGLKLSWIDVFAFGMYEKTSGGRISVVVVLGARFFPGIQLGFGFALTGVGGLVGVNRRADPDVLRARLASGAAGNTLFSDNPMRDAPTILGDMHAFFPPADGAFVVGPTLQIGWLTPIFRFDLGVFIEFPGPSKIIILGMARALVGATDELALLRLRMDIYGELNFTRSLIAFRAGLVNSTALGLLNVTGGAAFELSYGAQPYMFLSIGGFHPAFQPGAFALPSLARVGASLSVDVPVVDIWLRVELYLAATSNTLQLGGKVEAGVEIGPFSAHGWFELNALIQFRPFRFSVDFNGGFEIEAFGTSFAGVRVAGTISGPGPVVIYAKASVKRLGIKVSHSETFRLGRNNADTVAKITDLYAVLLPQIKDPANLRTAGEDPLVAYRRERAPVQGVLVSPAGALIWEQKVVPFDTMLMRCQGTPLDGVHTLRISADGATDEQDWFSPGTYFELNQSQALNNTPFQELKSGLRLSSAELATGLEKTCQIELNVIKIPARSRFLVDFKPYMVGMFAALTERGATPAVDPGEARVKLSSETWNVSREGVAVEAGLAPIHAFQKAHYGGGIAVPSTESVVDISGV